MPHAIIVAESESVFAPPLADLDRSGAPRKSTGLAVQRCGLRFKHHFNVYDLDDGQIALISEKSSLILNGELYKVLLPLINTGRDMDQIVAILAADHDPSVLYYTLMRALSSGLLTDCDETATGMDDHELTWWHSLNTAPGAALEARARRSLGLVVGDGAGAIEIAVGRFKAALERRGLSLREAGDCDLMVVMVEAYADPATDRQIMTALAQSAWVLPCRPIGIHVLIGPLLKRDEVSRWRFLQQRLESHQSIAFHVAQKCGDYPMVPIAATPESIDIAIGALWTMLDGLLAENPDRTLRGGIIDLDTQTLQRRFHHLADKATLTDRPFALSSSRIDGAVILGAQSKHYRRDGGHRVCSPHETLERLEPLISPLCGVVDAIEPCGRGDSSALKVYATRQTYPFRQSFHNKDILSTLSGAMGKGATDAQARVSCLAEAIERYSIIHTGDEYRRSGCYRDFAGDAVDLDAVLLFSADQFAAAKSWNELYGRSYHRVPDRYDLEAVVEWSPMWSLTHDCTRWLPTMFCYMAYGPTEPGHRFCYPDSNGCASGNTIEEATLQGLLELIERDSTALWWYNRLQRPAVDLSSFDDPFIIAMKDYYAGQGRALHVLDITSDVGIPVAVAISWRQAGGDLPVIGLGSHLDGRIAVSRALSELNQLMIDHDDRVAEPMPSDMAAICWDASTWYRYATVDNQPYLRPAAGDWVNARNFGNLATGDIRDDVMFCVERLRKRDIEVIVADCTRRHVDFPVARVIAPGLRHFWRRLAPGRLYDVPVRSGWMSRPCAESDLNPISFIF